MDSRISEPVTIQHKCSVDCVRWTAQKSRGASPTAELLHIWRSVLNNVRLSAVI
jgi:hypothetical protein